MPEAKEVRMGLGVSFLLIAAGAILAWAVEKSPNGVDINTVGYILLVVGIIGAVVSMIFWSSWAGPGYFTRRRTVVDEGAPVDPRY
jgi:beta-lactamase regulating signal transducer with metallopeptidase domain